MKRIWVVANWKSNKTLKEALDWVSKIGPQLEKKGNIQVIVCPPMIDLVEVAHAIRVGNFPLLTGVQNLSPFGVGAFTGEVAAGLLKDFVSVAVLGHSERRDNFGETDEMIAKKVDQALENGITPLVCVQNENTPVPSGCNLVAYEPPNAISTSGAGAKPDDPTDAARVARALKDKYGEELEVIYGGSVKSDNAQVYLEKPEISGVLPGAASLDPEEFLKIVEIAQRLS